MSAYLTRGTDIVRVSDGATLLKDFEDPDYLGFLAWVVEGHTPSPAPVDGLTVTLQARMDSEARSLGYDDLKTAITYRGDPNPKFAAEAEGFFQWRSAVWTTAYAHLARVQAGEVAFPTPDEAVAMMPSPSITYP